MPKKRVGLSSVIEQYFKFVAPASKVSVRAVGENITIDLTDQYGTKSTLTGFSSYFRPFVERKPNGDYSPTDANGLVDYIRAVIDSLGPGTSQPILSPSALGIVGAPSAVSEAAPEKSTLGIKGKEPAGEPTGEPAASSSRTVSGPRGHYIDVGPEDTVILMDPQGREVDREDMPEVNESQMGHLLKAGYSAMILTPAGRARYAARARERAVGEELGRNSVIAQILQATRSGDLKASEVLEITQDMTQGELDPVKLKKIGTTILKARRRALEEWSGSKKQAKSLGPRRLKQLLVGLYGK